jgi:nitrate reductase delta subunit
VSRSENPFDRLAELLSYPGPDLACAAEETRDLLSRIDPEAAGHAAAFLEGVEPLSREELEELYTRTFDLNPVCALEVGWHLYGEAYERGAFLVKMRELLARTGLEEGTELPDHLTSVLPAFSRIPREEAAVFAEGLLLKALDKMLAGFQCQQGQENPYEHALRAVRALIVEATV